MSSYGASIIESKYIDIELYNLLLFKCFTYVEKYNRDGKERDATHVHEQYLIVNHVHYSLSLHISYLAYNYCTTLFIYFLTFIIFFIAILCIL